jgi:hypothetical protein
VIAHDTRSLLDFGPKIPQQCVCIVGDDKADVEGLEDAFGARHCVTESGVDAARGVEGSAQCFEERLDFVVVVAAVLNTGMQIHATVVGDTLKEMEEQVGTERTHPGRNKLGIEDAVGTPAEIDGHKPQGLVHWHIAMGGTHDATPVAECFVDGLPEADTDILGGVMIIDVQIAVGGDGDVELSVFGHQGQHMVQKADTGLGMTLPGTVDIDAQRNTCFTGSAGNLSLTHSDSSELKNRVVGILL